MAHPSTTFLVIGKGAAPPVMRSFIRLLIFGLIVSSSFHYHTTSPTTTTAHAAALAAEVRLVGITILVIQLLEWPPLILEEA